LTNDTTALADSLRLFSETNFIRTVELHIADNYHPTDDNTESPMKCPTHLSIGQEHVPVAVRAAVGQNAHAYATHRAHAAYLAWNGDLNAMIAELFGKATGCAGGWGGSMHLIDESVGFMGTSAIVGSSVSYAVGDALASQLSGSERVTVAFVGDAVPETGQFWESLNFAVLRNLNLLIVLENNDVATATPRSQRQGGGRLGLLENSINSPVPMFWVEHTRQNQAQQIYDATNVLLERDGPKLLWVDTDRMAEHVGPQYEITADDQLRILKSTAANMWGRVAIEGIEKEAEAKVRDAFALAHLAEPPDWKDTPYVIR
jgi:TPP-dependent pyruvate/acetoin dehydrogenase alpha subunit